jgi:hypothetical protein
VKGDTEYGTRYVWHHGVGTWTDCVGTLESLTIHCAYCWISLDQINKMHGINNYVRLNAGFRLRSLTEPCMRR